MDNLIRMKIRIFPKYVKYFDYLNCRIIPKRKIFLKLPFKRNLFSVVNDNLLIEKVHVDIWKLLSPEAQWPGWCFPPSWWKMSIPKFLPGLKMFQAFQISCKGKGGVTIGRVGDDTVCGWPLQTISNVSDALSFIVFVFCHSYCWLSLHRVSVISEM